MFQKVMAEIHVLMILLSMNHEHTHTKDTHSLPVMTKCLEAD